MFDVAWNVPGDFNPHWKSDGIFPFFPRDNDFVWKMPRPTISVFFNRYVGLVVAIQSLEL